jgi:hypothetical protein
MKDIEDLGLGYLERLLSVCEAKLSALENQDSDKPLNINDVLGLNAAIMQITKNIKKYTEFE